MMVSPKFKPIKQEKISTKIVEQIKSLINEGDLKPGDALPPERELVKVFNVSRASLREALNSLTGMGWLGALPGINNSQVWVSKVDAQRAHDLIVENEERKSEQAKAGQENAAETIEVVCEKCGKISAFSPSRRGTIQSCGKCASYLDVPGDGDWDDEYWNTGDAADEVDEE